MEKRPLIGIPMRIELETDRFYLSRHYSEAVEAAGGTPVHISLIPKVDYIDSVVESLDGILMPGSDSDVRSTSLRARTSSRTKKCSSDKR